MAKTTNLPVATPLAGPEKLPIVQAGQSRQTTVAAIAALGQAVGMEGAAVIAAIMDALAAASGSDEIGFTQGGTLAATRTLQQRGRNQIWLTDFEGADPTGATNNVAILNRALEVAVERKIGTVHVNGWFKYGAGLVIPEGAFLQGYARMISDQYERAESCLIKDFDGTGVLFSGNNSGTDGVQFDSIPGKAGTLVQVTGTRWKARSICLTNGGGDNLVIGKTEAGASSINANGWDIGWLHSYGAGGCGIVVDHTNTSSVGATWPQGAPDCGVGGLFSADIRACGSHAVSLRNSIDNFFGLIRAQECGGYGLHFGAGAWSNLIQKLYSEKNMLSANPQGYDVLLDADARQNTVLRGARAARTRLVVHNNSGNRSNTINGRSGSIGEADLKLVPDYHGGDFNQVMDDLTPPVHRQYVGPNLVPAGWQTVEDGVSGSMVEWFNRTSGFGIESKARMRQNGAFELLKAAGLFIAGNKVLGAQQAAIANPAGGGTVDAEGRAALVAILGAMRAHGLIAAA